MNETVHAGLIGALLSKTAGALSAGGDSREGAAGTGAAENSSGFFAAIFDTTAAPVKNPPNEPAGLFVDGQPTVELRNPVGPAFETVQPEAPDAQNPRRTDLLDFRQGDHSVRHREILFHRNEAGPVRQYVNPLETPVTDLRIGRATPIEFGAAANRYDREFEFSTIKLRSGDVNALTITPGAETFRPAQITPGLTTIKGVDAPGAIVRDDIQSSRLDENIPIRPGERNSLIGAPALQAVNLPSSEFVSLLTPVFEELAEFSPVSERRLREFASIETALNGQSLAQKAPGGTPQLATPNPIGNFVALTFANNFDPGFRTDGEHPFDPAITAPASLRSANNAAFAVAPTSPNFTAMAGVLPQIQAAIVSRAGGDSIEVRLDPPDLGRVRIDFNVENGETIKAVVAAERSETLDHLKRNIADLEQQLRQSGFASISFEFSSENRQFGAAGDEPRAEGYDSGDANSAMDRQEKVYLNLRENAQLDLLL